MAYLKLLVNPDEDTAFLVVNLPRRGDRPTTLEKLGQYANQRSKSLFAASFELGLEQHLRTRSIRPAGLHQLAGTARRSGAARQSGGGGAGHDQGDPLRGVALRDLPSPKAAEMRMQNVSTLYRWITEMLEGMSWRSR
jgi:ATP-dependent DNA helicase Rep